MNEHAKRWTGEACTLDGKPATVVGRKLPFAIVHTVDVLDGPIAEFAWPTVDRIMQRDRSFKS